MDIRNPFFSNGLQCGRRVERRRGDNDITSAHQKKGPDVAVSANMEHGQDNQMPVTMVNPDVQCFHTGIFHLLLMGVDSTAGNSGCPAGIENHQWVVGVDRGIRFAH